MNTGSAGNPPLTCTGSCARATTAGHSGTGWSPSGNSYLGNGDQSVPAGVPLSNNAYTVCAWIKPSGQACNGMSGVVGWGDWASVNGSNGLATHGGDSFYNYWFSTGPQTSAVDMLFPTPGLCSTQRWGHFLCRWDPSTSTKACFWNGKLAKQQTLPNGHGTKDGFFRIGRYAPVLHTGVPLYCFVRTTVCSSIEYVSSQAALDVSAWRRGAHTLSLSLSLSLPARTRLSTTPA